MSEAGPSPSREEDLDEEVSFPRLTVSCLNKPQIEGTYDVLYAGRRRVNGLPVWATGTKRLYSFFDTEAGVHEGEVPSSPSSSPLTHDPQQRCGHWSLAIGADAPFTGKRILMTSQPHFGYLPPTCAEWLAWDNLAEEWRVDESVHVATAMEHFTPSHNTSPASPRTERASGTHAEPTPTQNSLAETPPSTPQSEPIADTTAEMAAAAEAAFVDERKARIAKQTPPRILPVITADVLGMHVDVHLKVTKVVRESPADRAGVRVYDTVVYAVDPNTTKAVTLVFEKDLHHMAAQCKFLQIGLLRNRGKQLVTTLEVPWVKPTPDTTKRGRSPSTKTERRKGWNELCTHIPADDDSVSKVRRRRLFHLLDKAEEGVLSLPNLLSGHPLSHAKDDISAETQQYTINDEDLPSTPLFQKSPLLHTLSLQTIPESYVVASFNIALRALRRYIESKRQQKMGQKRKVIGQLDPTLDTTMDEGEMDGLRHTVTSLATSAGSSVPDVVTPPRSRRRSTLAQGSDVLPVPYLPPKRRSASGSPAIPAATLDLKGFRVFLEALRRHVQLFNVYGVNDRVVVRLCDFERCVPLLISWGSSVLDVKGCGIFGSGERRKTEVGLAEFCGWAVGEGLDMFIEKPRCDRVDAHIRRSKSAESRRTSGRSPGRSPLRSEGRSPSRASQPRSPSSSLRRSSRSASSSAPQRRPDLNTHALTYYSLPPPPPSPSPSSLLSPRGESNGWDSCAKGLPTGMSAVAKASRRKLFASIERICGSEGTGQIGLHEVVQGLLDYLGVDGADGGVVQSSAAGTMDSTAAATAIASSHRQATAVCQTDVDTTIPQDSDVVDRRLFRYILEALRMHFQLYAIIGPHSPPMGISDFRVVSPLLRAWGLSIPPDPLVSLRQASSGLDRADVATFCAWAVHKALQVLHDSAEASPIRSQRTPSPRRVIPVMRREGYEVA